ncbi:MAG TPA: bifunctional [glutamine synthetase] adenylyltransferase/[glutamine synthetase]-adenylyl-L-tyrosine phosphorylase [Micromonosporaceae bacterium]
MSDEEGRRGGRSTRLSRYGFADATRATDLLGSDGLGLWPAEPDDPILDAIAATADPDLVVRQLHRIAETGARTRPEAAAELVAALRTDGDLRARLLAVLGASAALGDHLAANPFEWRSLSPAAERADLEASTNAAELRLAYRRELLRIAADDLTGAEPIDATMAALSRLADATLTTAFNLAGGTSETRLAVIAMGKCGGNELNYVSDVDVIFVCGDDVDPASCTPVAIKLMQICAQVAWPVDAALRPEGGRGPLVRTLAGHVAYYRKWARTWEFQALLKARPAAGDLGLGREWLDAVQEFIWRAAERPEAVDDIRAMRRRIIDAVPRNEVDREIKRGPGGLRDIEFAVQLLQLVHGRADESLRSPSTIAALTALTDGGYVGRTDGEALLSAYRFLRTVEHRLQLQRLRRTHTVPSTATPNEAEALRWLAQALGYRGNAQRDAVAAFRAEWVGHNAEVRRLHAKLLYRPLLEAVARVPRDDLRLTPEAARSRLEVLGFADPAGALRHLQALTGGVSRAAAIQHTLLPVLLSEFADEPEPDRALLAYRKVSEALGSTPWYLRLLRDGGPVALRLAEVLGRSRYATDLLIRDPEALRVLADDKEMRPRPPGALRDSFTAAAGRYSEPKAAATAVRAMRRRELFRVASGDLLRTIDGIAEVGSALSGIADATLAATLSAALGAADATAPGLRFAIIGMGRLGGEEMGYASDADVLFVYEPPAGIADDVASGAALAVAEQVRTVLSIPAPDPPLVVDADLRPEGRQGPLVRSLAAYQLYYARWSKVWEAQALLRARFVAGDAELGARFIALADGVRYPAGGLTPEQVTEIRRIKARVEGERLRGADPGTHVKLGRGGLADVEWVVQLMQLRHGHAIGGLRTTETLAALSAARTAGLIEAADAEALEAAWVAAARVRNALMLVRGRPSDQLPRQGPELAGVVRVLSAGVGHRDAGEFVDDHLKTARHARAVFDRLFHE